MPSADTSSATSIVSIHREILKPCSVSESWGYTPPPRGVPGCGASRIAKPGVKIWPPEITKSAAKAEATHSGSNAVEPLKDFIELVVF